MNIENITSTLAVKPRIQEAPEEINKKRKDSADLQAQAAQSPEKSAVQPEELLNQIKALTENGRYAVQFEKDRDVDELVVKIVDSETHEVIRQIPPKELLELSQYLKDLRGNIVNTAT